LRYFRLGNQINFSQTSHQCLAIVIENTSRQAQGHFDEWNSWGYFNLALEWTDAQGKSGTVTKVPRRRTRFYDVIVAAPTSNTVTTQNTKTNPK
jgi:hypothetical protein